MKSFNSLFRDISAKNSWTPTTEVNVLLDVFDTLVREGKVTTEELEKATNEHHSEDGASNDLDSERLKAANKFFEETDQLGSVEDADGWERTTSEDSMSRKVYIDRGGPGTDIDTLVVTFKPDSAEIDHVTLNGEDIPLSNG